MPREDQAQQVVGGDGDALGLIGGCGGRRRRDGGVLRGDRMSRDAEAYFSSRLGERFACSPEAAVTAHQIMHAPAVLVVLFGEDESAAEVGAEGRRRCLVRALGAVLRTPG